MLQRIQSIFLLLVGLFFGGEFLFPFAESNKAIPNYFSDSIYNIQDHPVLMGLCILGIIVSLISIFLYNNRSLQIKLGNLLIICSIFLPLVAFLLVYNEGTSMTEGSEIYERAGIFLPIGALLFSILAVRAIRKDENTVQSMDRLR